MITTLNEQVKILRRAGGGSILAGTRTLRSTCPSPAWDRSSAPGCSASSATTRDRYASGKARKNYAATSPITRASGKKKVVAARFVHNDRLVDALNGPGLRRPERLARRPRLLRRSSAPAASSTTPPSGELANRLVGILHGCLKTRTLYDEATAWGHRENLPQSSVAA